MCGKFFQFMVFKFLENTSNLWIFTHGPVPQSKLQVEIFEDLFTQDKTERVEETMICFIKIESENLKMTWNIIIYLYFV